MPEAVPTSDKAISSKMDLLLTKAELSTMLVHICDNIISLFPIFPLWPLIGSRSNFSSLICFACDDDRWRCPCPYLLMPLAFCYILSPNPVEDGSSRVTWWAPGGQLRSTHQVTRAHMPGTTLVGLICCPNLAQVKVTAAGVQCICSVSSHTDLLRYLCDGKKGHSQLMGAWCPL